MVLTEVIGLKMFEDMGEGGVKKQRKSGDILYGWPLLSFRQRVTKMDNAGHNSSLEKDDVTDDQILAFYNFATATLLTALEVYKKVFNYKDSEMILDSEIIFLFTSF